MRGFALLGCLVFFACTDAEATGRAPSSDSAVLDEDSSPTDALPESPACSVPVSQKCTTAPLCGCAPDENCGPTEAGTLACGKAGSKGEGAACAETSDCDRGLICNHYYADVTLQGTCQAYCQTVADCPARTWSWRCDPTGPSAYKVCEANCDLRFPCGSGGCVPVQKKGTESMSECLAVGTGKGPGTCPKSQVECAPGYGCVSGNCLPWCRLLVGGCASGTTCRPLTSPPIVIDGTEYGVCAP